MTINHVKKIKMKARKKTITLINNVNGNDKKIQQNDDNSKNDNDTVISNNINGNNCYYK